MHDIFHTCIYLHMLLEAGSAFAVFERLAVNRALMTGILQLRFFLLCVCTHINVATVYASVSPVLSVSV